jgi:drug/metabolite transporter (DMT)-like permease
MVGVGLIILSATAFGCLPILARFTYASGTEPVALLCVRFLIAGTLMLTWMLQTRKPWPSGRVLGYLMLLGGVGYVGQSLSYFTALTLASASLVALLLYLYPAVVTLIVAVVARERIDRKTMSALALALLGSALVIGLSGTGTPLGIALGLAAALIYAIYIFAGSKVTPLAGAIPSTTVIILTAAAVFSLVAAVTRPEFPGTTAGWVSLVGVAIVSVVAIVSFFEALERLGPADASTLSTFEPVVTVLLAALLLGETVTAAQVGGGVLILAAVLLLARHEEQSFEPDVRAVH